MVLKTPFIYLTNCEIITIIVSLANAALGIQLTTSVMAVNHLLIMLKRNIASIVVTVLSLCLLYPGLSSPILQIVISAELPIIGKTTFYEQTQSILETVDTLYSTNNQLVAMLIFLFSVIVPVTKAMIMRLWKSQGGVGLQKT